MTIDINEPTIPKKVGTNAKLSAPPNKPKTNTTRPATMPEAKKKNRKRPVPHARSSDEPKKYNTSASVIKYQKLLPWTKGNVNGRHSCSDLSHSTEIGQTKSGPTAFRI